MDGTPFSKFKYATWAAIGKIPVVQSILHRNICSIVSVIYAIRDATLRESIEMKNGGIGMRMGTCDYNGNENNEGRPNRARIRTGMKFRKSVEVGLKIALLITSKRHADTPFTRHNRLNNRFDNRLNVCLHDAARCSTGCSIGLITGCIV